MKNRFINLLGILVISIITVQNLYSQIFVEGSYTWSKDFGYQKDDSYPEFNAQTGTFEKTPTYLGDDYTFKYFKIGIGYRFEHKNRPHTLSLNYNQKGAGGVFDINIFLDEFALESLGSILIGHIQFGGYTVDSTTYMFGFKHENIGLKYSTTLFTKFGIKLNPFVQFDYSYNPRSRIISVNNIPVPAATSYSLVSEGFKKSINRYLLSLGLEVEVPINKLISSYISGSQSITSYTRKGDIFSNRTFVSVFEIGFRFYQ